jgi:hypothetical protein
VVSTGQILLLQQTSARGVSSKSLGLLDLMEVSASEHDQENEKARYR